MDNKEPKCPCKDCITYAICKTILYQENHLTLVNLRKRCELLDNHMNSRNPKTYSNFVERFYETLRIFKIKENQIGLSTWQK